MPKHQVRETYAQGTSSLDECRDKLSEANKEYVDSLSEDEKERLEWILDEVPHAPEHPALVLKLAKGRLANMTVPDEDDPLVGFLFDFIDGLAQQLRKARSTKRTAGQRGDDDKQREMEARYLNLNRMRAAYLARQIIQREDVRQFRDELLGGGDLGMDDVVPWVLERATTEGTVGAEGSGGVIPLFYSDDASELVAVHGREGTQLHRLQLIVQSLFISGLPWRPDQLLVVVLTGIVPTLQAVGVRVRGRCSYLRPTWIPLPTSSRPRTSACSRWR
ncbi:MAG: hypothetical protein Q8O67_17145 [Deltaproteobacteria bacterium]|nr:hypothetical protein [Deltaproteobacteria bacterium]